MWPASSPTAWTRPRTRGSPGARKAGFSTEQVIEALTEAEAKLREIEQLAGSLNRELTARLLRIVAQGRAVLAQIERTRRTCGAPGGSW